MASLKDKLRARKGKKNPGKAQFLALQGEISDALEAGWSVKEIWRQLHEDQQVTIQYPQFCSYVRTLIHQIPSTQITNKSSGHSVEKKTTHFARKKETPKKFVHDPTPSKELLEMLHGKEE